MHTQDGTYVIPYHPLRNKFWAPLRQGHGAQELPKTEAPVSVHVLGSSVHRFDSEL